MYLVDFYLGMGGLLANKGRLYVYEGLMCVCEAVYDG